MAGQSPYLDVVICLCLSHSAIGSHTDGDTHCVLQLLYLCCLEWMNFAPLWPPLLSVKSFGTVDWICNPCSQPGLGVGFFCSFEVGSISKAREMSAIQVRVLKWVIPASKRDEGTLGKMKRKSPFLLWNISRQSIFGSIDKIGSFSGIWMH